MSLIFKEVELNTKQVYEKHASAYSKQRNKNLFEKKWLDKFISLLSGNSVLDLGCGPADPIAKYLIQNNLDVTGADYSKAMIDIAKSNFPENQWHQMDMRELSLDEKFDGILAWNSFFHLNNEDQFRTLEVIASHLKPSGVFMFTAGPDKGEVLGKVDGQDVYHSSLSVNEYTNKLADLSIELREFKLNDLECNSHSVFLAQKKT